MKIRTRLSLQFIGLFAILLLSVLTSIYFVVASQWKNNFFRQLEDRAITVGHNYLAEDNFTAAEYEEVLRKFPRTLPKEQIRIYTSSFEPTYIAEQELKWDKHVLNQIYTQKKIQFKQDGDYIVGVFYEDNSGDYIIVAKATNENGEKALHQLRSIMLFSLLIALIITFILSRIFSNSLLNPIKSMINHIQDKDVETLIQPIPVEHMSNDEIKVLSNTINTLFLRLHLSFDNQQSFVSHASHELKTPIASMMGNAEIALRSPRSTTEYQEVLEGIVRDASHIDRIINNLLTLSQLNNARYSLIETPFETFWWTVIDHLIAKQKDLNLNLALETQEELYALYFTGNSHLLELALSNIILNAHKFSHQAPIQLTLTTDDSAIIIAIADQGIGIHPEDLDKLFLPFFRSSNALGIKGTGLGLSLAYKIVELHKGTVNVTSILQQGTTVTIRIPKQFKKTH
ncbi:HAMP domain-containing sensor histidine kinase [Myroides sp. WP-1]|uniref:sensor histidine kinase n=1 Tax=Myroides sp. WP-1 TaxID=2759944 RepID=UPI0015FBF286|nr:HAMP domain-containing sensor histidine kinase [Myroides sp. WP-1]MBB1138477.1 HAMP domain-containing histidine kinase [Myroides sp. WP-1]